MRTQYVPMNGLLDDIYTKELQPIVVQTVDDAITTGIARAKEHKWEIIGIIAGIAVLYAGVNYVTSYLAALDALKE